MLPEAVVKEWLDALTWAQDSGDIDIDQCSTINDLQKQMWFVNDMDLPVGYKAAQQLEELLEDIGIDLSIEVLQGAYVVKANKKYVSFDHNRLRMQGVVELKETMFDLTALIFETEALATQFAETHHLQNYTIEHRDKRYFAFDLDEIPGAKKVINTVN